MDNLKRLQYQNKFIFLRIMILINLKIYQANKKLR